MLVRVRNVRRHCDYRTRCISCVGEIAPILRTLYKDTPEGAAYFALSEPWQIDVPPQVALGEGDFEIIAVDVISENFADEDG